MDLLCFGMPLAQETLSDILHFRDCSPQEVWKLAKGIALGIHYLHHLNPAIIHGDLKPKNVLVCF